MECSINTDQFLITSSNVNCVQDVEEGNLEGNATIATNQEGEVENVLSDAFANEESAIDHFNIMDWVPIDPERQAPNTASVAYMAGFSARRFAKKCASCRELLCDDDYSINMSEFIADKEYAPGALIHVTYQVLKLAMKFNYIGDIGYVSFSVYMLLHHFVCQSSLSPLHVPVNSRAGHERLKLYQNVHQDMVQNSNCLGGVRFESRIRCRTLAGATHVMVFEPWNLSVFLETEVKVYCITVQEYILKVPLLIEKARRYLRELGMLAGHRQGPLRDDMKRVFGDLKQLFGEATYKFSDF